MYVFDIEIIWCIWKKFKSLRYAICNIFCEFYNDFLHIASEPVIYNFLRNLSNQKKNFFIFKTCLEFKKMDMFYVFKYWYM